MKVYIVIGQTQYDHSLDLVGCYRRREGAAKKLDNIEKAKARYSLRNTRWAMGDFEGKEPRRPIHTEGWYYISEMEVRPTPADRRPAKG